MKVGAAGVDRDRRCMGVWAEAWLELFKLLLESRPPKLFAIVEEAGDSTGGLDSCSICSEKYFILAFMKVLLPTGGVALEACARVE